MSQKMHFGTSRFLTSRELLRDGLATIPAHMPDPVFDSPPAPPDPAAVDGRAPAPPSTTHRSRRGRPPIRPADGVATEIRRRRDVLGLTLHEAAALTGVSPTVICEVERGRRTPSLRTYAKLRDGLGLTDPPATLLGRRVADVPRDDQYRATLAACVLTAGGTTLTNLAAAMGVSIPAVREGLSVLTDRLAHVGLSVVGDGVTVRVAPLAFAHDAVAAVTRIETVPVLTERQLTILCIAGYAGAVTRRRIEDLCGADCESVLARMADAGLLECTRDHMTERAPNLYRITTTALLALGYPTIEAFRDGVASQLDGAELLKLEQLRLSDIPARH